MKILKVVKSDAKIVTSDQIEKFEDWIDANRFEGDWLKSNIDFDRNNLKFYIKIQGLKNGIYGAHDIDVMRKDHLNWSRWVNRMVDSIAKKFSWAKMG